MIHDDSTVNPGVKLFLLDMCGDSFLLWFVLW